MSKTWPLSKVEDDHVDVSVDWKGPKSQLRCAIDSDWHEVIMAIFHPISWSHQQRFDSLTVESIFFSGSILVFEDVVCRRFSWAIWLSGYFSWLWLVAPPEMGYRRPSLWISISTGCWCPALVSWDFHLVQVAKIHLIIVLFIYSMEQGCLFADDDSKQT